MYNTQKRHEIKQKRWKYFVIFLVSLFPFEFYCTMLQKIFTVHLHHYFIHNLFKYLYSHDHKTFKQSMDSEILKNCKQLDL